MSALVRAGLELVNDDSWFAIEASIESWLDFESRSHGVSPIWNWTYLYPADRS